MVEKCLEFNLYKFSNLKENLGYVMHWQILPTRCTKLLNFQLLFRDTTNEMKREIKQFCATSRKSRLKTLR